MPSTPRPIFLALATLAAATLLAAGPALAQITPPGTDYPSFWSGELRIFAQKADTRVTLLDLDTGSPLGLPGDPATDGRIDGGPCYLVDAAGNRTDDPANPFVLPDRGSMFRCVGGLGPPFAEIQVRILTSDPSGGSEDKPVTVWTGSTVEAIDNSWGSFLPADLSAGDVFGREIGSGFLGFTQSELIVIAPRIGAATPRIEVTNYETGATETWTLDGSLPLCPEAGETEPPIAPAVTPCYLYDGPETQVVYDGRYDDARVSVTSSVTISVLTGHRLLGCASPTAAGCFPDNQTITHQHADWTATPPSWGAGDEGLELGTLFFTFAREALTVFPTQHDTTVEILDLSDGDDSRTVVLEHGDLLAPKIPGDTRLSVFTPFLDTRIGQGIVARTAGPALDLVTANGNPFDNDVVAIYSDKPILVYQGPAGSDVNEFADVAFSMPIGQGERLVLCYAQNFGGSNDLQLFSYPGANRVEITSLSFTRGFTGRLGVPGHHDFEVQFEEAAPPAVTPVPDHTVFVTNGIPGEIQHFGSGAWSGELLALRSERPITVVNGDYDSPHFGAYLPFIPTTRNLPPVAVIAADLTEVCFGTPVALDGASSFDQDSDGPDPQIVLYEWDFGDGTRLATTEPVVTHYYIEPGSYLVELVVTDNEGLTDSDYQEITVLFGDAARCRPCAPCEGKVTELALRYDGAAEALVEVVQKRSGETVFSGLVLPGETFEFQGTEKWGTLGPEIRVYVDGEYHAVIHTSCSQPIGPGLVRGDFTVVSGSSRNGGLLCPLGACDDPSCDGSDDKKPPKNKKKKARHDR